MIKFNRYNVTDTVTKKKAKVFYSLDNRTDRRPAVTIYAKDYGSAMTDYFEKGSVVLFEDNPNYSAARNRAEENSRLSEERRAKRLAKFAA